MNRNQIKNVREHRNIIDSGTGEEERTEERRTVRRTRSTFSGGENSPVRRIVEARGQKLDISGLQTLVRALIRHKDCWPFDEAITEDEVPDYHQIISHPMDFGTIE